MTILDIVGLLSGLLAIFSFSTGITSVGQLRRASGREGGADIRKSSGASGAGGPERRRARIILWVSVPVFVVSLAVTLTAGLGGSDTGGAQFVLLVEGAALLLVYAQRMRRRMPWSRFLALCIVVIGASGLLMGVMSRGEEVEGLVAGLVIGACVGLLGLAFPGTTEPRSTRGSAADNRSPRTDLEREVLRVARREGGEVSPAQVAVDSSISIDDASVTLDQLAGRGFCQRDIRPNGAAVYRFPDFLSG